MIPPGNVGGVGGRLLCYLVQRMSNRALLPSRDRISPDARDDDYAVIGVNATPVRNSK